MLMVLIMLMMLMMMDKYSLSVDGVNYNNAADADDALNN